MREPSVSVIIPTFNRAHLIGRALQSVLQQTGPGDEIIVIDDGSTDDTEVVVRKMAGDRVRYIWIANSGAGAARNRGVQEAKGELLAFLDSDDEWLPGKLDVQRRFMAAQPEVVFCFTDFASNYGGSFNPRTLTSWQSDQNGWRQVMGEPVKYSSLADLPDGTPDFDVYSGDAYRVEMHASYLQINCMVVRRAAGGDATRFTEGVRTWEDWECFGRLAQRGRLVYLDYLGALQHAHPGPRVTDADWVARAEARMMVLRNVWGSDLNFLEKHGDEYHALIQQQKVLKVRGLIVLGRTREARQEIRKLTGVPVKYRAASQLPGRVMTALVRLRRALRAPSEISRMQRRATA
jgi:glycosyltransferase involved in cell wall biosynthesis